MRKLFKKVYIVIDSIKGFCKSINTAQTYCLLSSDSSRSSISLITAWAVETFFENQTVTGVKYYVHLEISLLFCV